MTVAAISAKSEGRRERRRTAMIAAARTLFLERGYDAVSVGEIVRCSGGSLSTFYDLFENKAGLLGAIVAEERFAGIDRLDAVIARGGAAAGMLRAIAESIQRDLTQDDLIGMMRIVMAESLRNAPFATAVYHQAHLPRVEWLTRLFADWAAHRQARIADPAMAAHLFLGLIAHAAQMRALFSAPSAGAGQAADRYLAGAVDLFVAGYAIETKTARAPA